MANKIVLVSDDENFFDYIRAKLLIRKSDELFCYKFDDIPEKLFILETATIIINSEACKEKTLDLLNIIKGIPSIVFAYNEYSEFKNECYKKGAFSYITMLTSDAEIQAQLIPALSVSALLEKNNLYKEILVQKEILTKNNEIFLNSNEIIDLELKTIKEHPHKAVFGAISPTESSKFFINPNIVETIILNNIRKNDILISFATNKYFIIMHDIDVANANKIWQKISTGLSEKVYASFVNITNQSREELINKALNELHLAINHNKNIKGLKNNPIQSLSTSQTNNSTYINFKMFKKEFCKKIEQIITPVFYQVQQKYSNKLMNVSITQNIGEGYGSFYIQGKTSQSCFKISSAGFSKINIDITYQKDNNIDTKRITLDPEELESGLLTDLLEQFIIEYKEKNK